MINTEHILMDSLSNVLEKMAFLTIMPIEEEMATPKEVLLSEIHFKGPQSGTLRILAGFDFTRLLAENMSAGEDTDHASCHDVFRELSNVTCGLLLPLLSGSHEDVFDITVPVVVGGQKVPSWNEFTADPDCHVLNVENNLIAIQLTFQRPGE
jgi:CheY-specific phosphatase CheX